MSHINSFFKRHFPSIYASFFMLCVVGCRIYTRYEFVYIIAVINYMATIFDLFIAACFNCRWLSSWENALHRHWRTCGQILHTVSRFMCSVSTISNNWIILDIKSIDRSIKIAMSGNQHWNKSTLIKIELIPFQIRSI